MKDEAASRRLARALIRVGTRAGKRVSALLTNMDTPLGFTIGNALETREALEVLHDAGPADVRSLTLALGAEMLLAASPGTTRKQAERELEQALSSGRALELMARMVAAQGGDARCVEDPKRLPRARARVAVRADRTGFVNDVDPYALAQVALALGAGRRRADQTIDPSAGIELTARRGDRVERGEPLCHLHATSRKRAEALVEQSERAFRIGARPKPAKLI